MHTFSETGPGVPAFLAKLWRLVEDNETNDLISWSADGRSFIIQNQAQFAKELLPLNYKHNNMASFIRQLNMYGFHKITSIDNGGLRFEKDEMEFTHPCFQKDHPYLLEHIKRKIANSKQSDDKSGLKVEAVNRVLTEVKNMRGRQDTLDSRFSTMKQENEALWREIAILRQKHLKQQQIVNKLIQFLVTIVQPTRTGLGTMNSNANKRRFQLMINDTPQSSKVRLLQILQNILVKKTSGNEGAVIQELGEVLEEVAYENDQELMNSEVPEVQSPASVTQRSPYRPNSQNDFIEEIVSPSQMEYSITNVKQENFDRVNPNNLIDCNEDVIDESSTGYMVDHVDEIDTNNMQLYDDGEMLNTPLVVQEMAKQQQIKDEFDKCLNQQANQSILKPNGKKNGATNHSNSNNKNQKSLLNIKSNRKIATARKPQTSNKTMAASTSTNASQNPIQQQDVAFGSKNIDNQTTNEKQQSTLYNAEDFISTEMPSDLFDDNSQLADKESPMLGSFNFETGYYNPNFNINDVKQKQQVQQNVGVDEDVKDGANNTNRDLSLTKVVSNDSDLGKISTLAEFDQHLDTVQTDLETLKDLLRGEGYQLDANSLLGHPGGNAPSISRVYLPSSAFDPDSVSKLFGGNEDVLGYDFPMSDLMGDRKGEDSASTSGSQLMAYKPNQDFIDLNELLCIDSNQDDNSILI